MIKHASIIGDFILDFIGLCRTKTVGIALSENTNFLKFWPATLKILTDICLFFSKLFDDKD